MAPTEQKRLRLSPTLVVAQVALSLPLLAGAGLFLQTLHHLRTRDLGFAAETLVTVRTNPEASGYTRERRQPWPGASSSGWARRPACAPPALPIRDSRPGRRGPVALRFPAACSHQTASGMCG